MMTSLRRIKLIKLNQHLVCPLCHGYFVEATTITECLHTFCKTCIVRYLKTSSFCPVCDVQVHKTKPISGLREDKTLQDVVFKLVPDLFRNEMGRRAQFYKEHPEAGGDRTEQSLKERRHFFHVDDQISLSLEFLPPAHAHAHALGLRPLRAPSFSLSHPPTKEEKRSSGGGSSAREAEAENGAGEGKTAEEEREDKEAKVKIPIRRYLKCPAAVQIRLLEKFIRLKYNLSSHHRVDIVHNGDCLSPELTLLDVVYMYKWTEDEPLKLQYTVIAPPLPLRKRPRPTTAKKSCSPEKSPKKPRLDKHESKLCSESVKDSGNERSLSSSSLEAKKAEEEVKPKTEISSNKDCTTNDDISKRSAAGVENTKNEENDTKDMTNNEGSNSLNSSRDEADDAMVIDESATDSVPMETEVSKSPPKKSSEVISSPSLSFNKIQETDLTTICLNDIYSTSDQTETNNNSSALSSNSSIESLKALVNNSHYSGFPSKPMQQLKRNCASPLNKVSAGPQSPKVTADQTQIAGNPLVRKLSAPPSSPSTVNTQTSENKTTVVSTSSITQASVTSVSSKTSTSTTVSACKSTVSEPVCKPLSPSLSNKPISSSQAVSSAITKSLTTTTAKSENACVQKVSPKVNCSVASASPPCSQIKPVTTTSLSCKPDPSNTVSKPAPINNGLKPSIYSLMRPTTPASSIAKSTLIAPQTLPTVVTRTLENNANDEIANLKKSTPVSSYGATFPLQTSASMPMAQTNASLNGGPSLSSKALMQSKPFVSSSKINANVPAVPPAPTKSCVVSNPASTALTPALKTPLPSSTTRQAVSGPVPQPYNAITTPNSLSAQRQAQPPAPRSLISNSYRSSLPVNNGLKINGMVSAARPAIDPTKPRLGRPPNSARIAAAAAGRIGPQPILPRGTSPREIYHQKNFGPVKSEGRGRPKNQNSNVPARNANRLIAPQQPPMNMGLQIPKQAVRQQTPQPIQNASQLPRKDPELNGMKSMANNVLNGMKSQQLTNKDLLMKTNTTNYPSPSHPQITDTPISNINKDLKNSAVSPSNTAQKHIANSSPKTSTSIPSGSAPLPPVSRGSITTSSKPLKSPGRSKTHNNGSASSILSIAQNLANKQLQQQISQTTNTSNDTSSSSSSSTMTGPSSVSPATVAAAAAAAASLAPQFNAALGLPAVNPALCAYMAADYNAAVHNLLLSQAAARIAMSQSNSTLQDPTNKKTDPAPMDLSPTNKSTPNTCLSSQTQKNSKGSSQSKKSPPKVTSVLSPKTSLQSVPPSVPSPKPAQSPAPESPSAPQNSTISPPTPEVTITKLPNTPDTPVTSTTTPPTAAKPAHTNTVSITKRPSAPSPSTSTSISSTSSNNGTPGKFAITRSPSNASVRQIPNPTLLTHQSEGRNATTKPVSKPPKQTMPLVTNNNNNNNNHTKTLKMEL